MRRRGFTLIETVLAVALSAMVIGVIATLYGFATIRLSDAYTKSSLADQLNSFADRLDLTIRNAKTCVSAEGGATLNCSMPTNGVDTDGDGVDDTWYADKSDASGNAQYTAGGHAWFYNAGAVGTYHTGTGNIWTAETVGATAPSAANTDKKFCNYFSGPARFPLVTGLSVTVNAAGHSVTYTLTGSTQIGSEKAASADDTTSRTVTLTRTVAWRNYK